MAHVEKLNIALTPEMAAVVRQCVESGGGVPAAARPSLRLYGIGS